MIHTIRVQTWGRRVAIVCDVCTLPGQPETALHRERSDSDGSGVSLADVVTIAESHMRHFPDTLSAEDLAATNAAQAAALGAPDWEGAQVEEQVEFGCNHAKWAGGPHCAEMTCGNYVNKHRFEEEAPHAPLPPTAKAFLTPGSGGPSLLEYLESEGER